MSADRRKQILIGFAALAVILVAVVAVVSPRFKSEDAMGAIGAVQKHRAPQITQKDVVLGDEQTKKQQQLAYADFLSDAAALQAISANISTASRAESANRIAASAADLRARYLAAARDQVADIEAIAAKNQLGRFSLEIDGVSIGAVSQLRDQDVAGLNARLGAELQTLDAALRSKDLRAVEADVAALGAMIEQRKLEAAAATLAQASAAVVDQRTQQAAMVRQRANYLNAVSNELGALMRAEEALSAGVRARSEEQMELGRAAQVLNDEATALAHGAVVNMKDQLAAETFAVDSFGRMASAVQNAVSAAARANTYNAASLAAFRNEAGNFVREVTSLGAIAESRAKFDMRGQVLGISNYLGATQNLGSAMRNESLVAECQAQMRNVSQAARGNALYASVLGDVESVGSRYLKGVSTLDQKSR